MCELTKHMTPPQGMGFGVFTLALDQLLFPFGGKGRRAGSVGSYQDKWSETQVCGIKCRHDNIG